MTVQTAIKRFGKTYAMVVGAIVGFVVVVAMMLTFICLPLIVYGLATGVSITEMAQTSYVNDLPRWLYITHLLWELGFIALVLTFLGWADEMVGDHGE